MGVREKLRDNRKLGLGVGLSLLVLSLGLIAIQLQGGRGHLPAQQKQAFYTDDDGATFFTDSVNRIVPFDHNGRQAYRADVFRDADGKEFVGLIYRHTATGRNEMQDYIGSKGMDRDPEGFIRQGIEYRGMEVKRPGGDEKTWRRNDEQTNEYLRTMVTDAAGNPAQLVIP